MNIIFNVFHAAVEEGPGHAYASSSNANCSPVRVLLPFLPFASPTTLDFPAAHSIRTRKYWTLPQVHHHVQSYHANDCTFALNLLIHNRQARMGQDEDGDDYSCSAQFITVRM